MSSSEARIFSMTEDGLGSLRRRLLLRLLGITAVASTAVMATWSLGANRLRLPVTVTIMAIGLGLIARAMKRTVDRARSVKVGLDLEQIWMEQAGAERRATKLAAIRRIVETKRGALILWTGQRENNLVIPNGLDDQGALREVLQSFRDFDRPRTPEWLGGALWVMMIILMVLGVSAHKLGVDWLAAPIGTIWSGIGLTLIGGGLRRRGETRRYSVAALGMVFLYLGSLYLRRAFG